MEYKVLVVDDDAGMRLVLRKVLEKIEGFKLTGEAENGQEAVQMAVSCHPDVIFMDAEMPVMNGIEAARRISEINPKTIFIFATAHEEYMPHAFELYSFDYLLKPFKIDRIKQTLGRIKDIGQVWETTKMNEIFRHEKGLDKLMIRNKEGINLVDLKDIILIQREERNTVIYTKNEKYMTSDGLSEIEERLDKTLFFRSHKSYIINISMISKMEIYGRWTYIVKFKDSDKDALLTYERYGVLEKFFNSIL
ncbi:MAG: DNA-binding response regulator [Eubacterium sp.]|jgi:two-component system LytT family response regulator|nr:DNA-binding response regulator [Eubacterium sp.]